MRTFRGEEGKDKKRKKGNAQHLHAEVPRPGKKGGGKALYAIKWGGGGKKEKKKETHSLYYNQVRAKAAKKEKEEKPRGCPLSEGARKSHHRLPTAIL